MEAVEVKLSNRIASVDCSEEQKQALRDFWSYTAPNCRMVPAFNIWLQAKKRAIKEKEPDRPLPGWDGKKRLFSRNNLSAGLFRATWQQCQEELGIEFQVQRTIPKAAVNVSILPVHTNGDDKYGYQTQCIQRMQRAFTRGGGIILSATGSGKTAIFGQFAKSLPQCKMLFVVDTLDLLYQSQKEIAHWAGEEVGLVGDTQFEPKRITTATIQTLHKHLQKEEFKAWFRGVKVLIIDELHEQMAKRNFKLLKTIRPIAIYGLTATLQLQKKEIRYKAFSFAGPVIFQFPLQEGVQRGVLTDGDVVQIAFPPVKAIPQDHQEAYRQQVTENTFKHDACYAIVQHLLKLGKYVIILVSRVQHIKDLHQLFRKTPHGIAYGAIKKTDRKLAIDDFEQGDVRLVLANGVFKKGVDMKRVDVGIDMAEMKSKNDALQKYGRLVRLHPDKDRLLYIDFTTQRTASDYGLRYTRSGMSRMRAYRAAGIQCKKYKVASVEEAVKVVNQKFCKKQNNSVNQNSG